MENGHWFKLEVFRCLGTTAINRIGRSKGRTIANAGNSGTAAVEVDVGVGLAVATAVLGLGACGLGAVKKGTKVTVPKLKSFLKS